MTTPITTPAAREVSNKVIVTTPAPVVDTENEESLNEEQDLEMNQESISQEKVPRKLSVIVEMMFMMLLMMYLRMLMIYLMTTMKLRIDLIKMTLVLRQMQTTMDGSTSLTVIQG